MTSENFGFTGQSTIEMTHDRFHTPHKQQEKKEDPDKGYALTLQQECICSLRVARVALRAIQRHRRCRFPSAGRCSIVSPAKRENDPGSGTTLSPLRGVKRSYTSSKLHVEKKGERERKESTRFRSFHLRVTSTDSHRQRPGAT